MEVSSPTVLPVARVQAPLQRRPAHLPRAESGGRDPQRQGADPRSKRSRSLIGFALHFTFRTEPRTRTANLLTLNQAPLPLG